MFKCIKCGKKDFNFKLIEDQCSAAFNFSIICACKICKNIIMLYDK